MKLLVAAIVIAGSASLASAGLEFPFDKCPITPDPTGLYRPPILLLTSAYKFNDKSIGVESRLICRDSGTVVLWTYQAIDCNGPCEAAWWPSMIEQFLPPNVRHVCDGCLFPRRRAAEVPAVPPVK